MLKADELQMLEGAVAAKPYGKVPWPEGQNRKRREYILIKWHDRGWTDFGVSMATSCLSEEGHAKAKAFLEANRHQQGSTKDPRADILIIDDPPVDAPPQAVTYDLSNVKVSIAGIPLTGFSDDDEIVIVSGMPKTVQVTVTVDSSSDAYRELSGLVEVPMQTESAPSSPMEKHNRLVDIMRDSGTTEDGRYRDPVSHRLFPANCEMVKNPSREERRRLERWRKTGKVGKAKTSKGRKTFKGQQR